MNNLSGCDVCAIYTCEHGGVVFCSPISCKPGALFHACMWIVAAGSRLVRGGVAQPHGGLLGGESRHASQSAADKSSIGARARYGFGQWPVI